MDKILYNSLMYDFYNELLTQKQRGIYELYHHSDLSLKEIAEQENISPQAVSDMLKRTEKSLLNYENKLKFAQNYMLRRKNLEEINRLLDEICAQEQEDLVAEIKNRVSILME